MKIDLSNLKNSIKESALVALNEAGASAHEDALDHIKSTYNTKINNSAFRLIPATSNDLVFKIKIKRGSVSLIKKVVRISPKGATVMVKRGSPKFIRRAFTGPWQKNSSKRFLFVNKGKRRRRALYTIGLKSMYKNSATIKILTNSFYKNFKKFFNNNLK